MNKGPQAVKLDSLLSVHAHLFSDRNIDSPPIRNPAVLRILATLTAKRLLERSSTMDDFSQLRFKCLLEKGPQGSPEESPASPPSLGRSYSFGGYIWADVKAG